MTRRRLLVTVAGTVALVAAVPPASRAIRDLIATRGAVMTYGRLIAAANAGNLAAVAELCSARYRREHPPEPARGGGVVGFPRQVHPNFRAWVEGAEARLCPANRVGTVYGFVREGGAWRYDGPVGLLRPDGRVLPIGRGGESSREKP